MSNFEYFQNSSCEYFPCHKGVDTEDFSCMFCYCPLYSLGDQCGGNFTYTESGVKDCSNCLRPHKRQNYGEIVDKLALVTELVKKLTENP
jgi:Zn-finger protein